MMRLLTLLPLSRSLNEIKRLMEASLANVWNLGWAPESFYIRQSQKPSFTWADMEGLEQLWTENGKGVPLPKAQEPSQLDMPATKLPEPPLLAGRGQKIARWVSAACPSWGLGPQCLSTSRNITRWHTEHGRAMRCLGLALSG